MLKHRGERTVNVNNCKFYASKPAVSWSGVNVSAISINASMGGKFIVNINNSTATGFAVNATSNSGLWGMYSGTNAEVNLDGTQVYPSN